MDLLSMSREEIEGHLADCLKEIGEELDRIEELQAEARTYSTRLQALAAPEAQGGMA